MWDIPRRATKRMAHTMPTLLANPRDRTFAGSLWVNVQLSLDGIGQGENGSTIDGVLSAWDMGTLHPS